MESVSDKKKKLHGYEFWKSIGSPKYVCAPMEHASELPFRLLTKRYGCQLGYTPMINAKHACQESNKYIDMNFSTCPEDRPVFAQFCGPDPEKLLASAKKIQHQVDAIDINFGCPQGIAKKGNYGAFLLENEELVLKIIKYLHENLDIPVTCKIRVFPNRQRSIDLAKKIQEAGCSVLTIHGRTKEQNKQLQGQADWDIIKRIKQELSIPVIANGNILTLEDANKCLDYTNCDAVMSAEGLLENPALFSGIIHDMDKLVLEYLEICNIHKPVGGDIKTHLFKFYYKGFQVHTDLREALSKCRDFDEFLDVALDMKKRRENQTPKEKLGWYSRYNKGLYQTYENELKNEKEPTYKPYDHIQKLNLDSQADYQFEKRYLENNQNEEEKKDNL